MTIEERKERERQQREQEIIDAAERVFFAKGYVDATMDGIAENAEVSKGTLYLYFNDKGDLYHAVCHRGQKVLMEMFTSALQNHDSGREQLLAVGRAYFQFARQYGDYFRMMLQSIAEKHPENHMSKYEIKCQQLGTETIQVVARAVRNGIEDGTITTEYDPMELAVILWGQSTGVIQIAEQSKKHLQNKFEVNIRRLVETHFTLTERGVRRNSGS